MLDEDTPRPHAQHTVPPRHGSFCGGKEAKGLFNMHSPRHLIMRHQNFLIIMYKMRNTMQEVVTCQRTKKRRPQKGRRRKKDKTKNRTSEVVKWLRLDQ